MDVSTYQVAVNNAKGGGGGSSSLSEESLNKINSNLVEPLNFNNYIYDISMFRENSYVFQPMNKPIWNDLVLRSVNLYCHPGIRDIVLSKLTTELVDTLFDTSDKIGQIFNALTSSENYMFGEIDVVLSSLNETVYSLVPQPIRDGIDRYVIRKQSESGIGRWFNNIFKLGSTTMDSCVTVDSILAEQEAVEKLFANELAMMFFVRTPLSMEVLVNSENAMALILGAVTDIASSNIAIKYILNNESIMGIFINNEQCLAAALSTRSGLIEMLNKEIVSKLILHSESAMFLIANTPIALETVCEFAKNLQTSTTSLELISNSMYVINNNISNIYQGISILDLLQNAKNVVDDTKAHIDSITHEAIIIDSTIDALLKNEILMSNIINNQNVLTSILRHQDYRDILLNTDMFINIACKDELALQTIFSLEIGFAFITKILGGLTLSDYDKYCNGTFLSAIAKNKEHASAVSDMLQTRRAKLIETLSKSDNFIKTTVNVGTGAGTWIKNDEDAFYIPISCYDDNDTNFTVYCSSSLKYIASASKHSGTSNITSGVSVRGYNVVGSGYSVGYVTFDVYTVKQ